LRLFVPHTAVQPATRIALARYPATYVELPKSDYAGYWRERWTEGQTFINVEHDVVPWPGALDALWRCESDWCAYGYQTDEQESAFPYLGCVKFSAAFIALFPDVWNGAQGWTDLDAWLALRADFPVCRHKPGVTNANPLLLR
jgi:hypothetical protein